MVQILQPVTIDITKFTNKKAISMMAAINGMTHEAFCDMLQGDKLRAILPSRGKKYPLQSYEVLYPNKDGGYNVLMIPYNCIVEKQANRQAVSLNKTGAGANIRRAEGETWTRTTPDGKVRHYTKIDGKITYIKKM